VIKKKIFVIGESGQLARCLKNEERHFINLELTFLNRAQVNFEKPLKNQLPSEYPFCIINTVAYTAVDSAESQKDLNWRINAYALEELVAWAQEGDVPIIHFSTDYVFDGAQQKDFGYVEVDEVNPQNEYGKAKLQGESNVLSYKSGIVFRIAWLYSLFGKNFLQTVLRKIGNKENMRVVNDQIGCPTSASALAYDILEWLNELNNWDEAPFGLFHYSHEGRVSWFEFAQEINGCTGNKIQVEAINSVQFETVARRPYFSLLNHNLANAVFNFPRRDWKEELQQLLNTRK
jgi:dTDP-4-dehydrorhamnose reductase